MPDRTCAVCSGSMEGRRSDATMCSPPCRLWNYRHPGKPRRVGPQTYTCEFCEQVFTRPNPKGKRPRFCTDRCWEAYRHRQRPFGEWRKENPWAPRQFVCRDCGVAGTDSGRGPRATLCPACYTSREHRRALEWQQANPARRAEIMQRWLDANPEAHREYYQRNKAAFAARAREYREANRDQVRAWKRDREHRRRAQKAATQVEVIRSLQVYERDRWTCQLCAHPVDAETQWPDPMSPSLDHIVPLSRGGGHVHENVQLAHLICNMQKGDSLP